MAVTSRLRWPLWCSLAPSTLDLLERADYLYDLRRDFAVPGEVVTQAFFDDALVGTVAGLRGFTWQTAPGVFAGARVDEYFVFMSLRLRTVAYEPGLRLAMSIDRCSLPLGRQMLQVMDVTPRPDGGCHLRWRIAVRYVPGMSVLAPMVTPLFQRVFERMLNGVERRCAG
jgi:hypothetical protein